MVATSNDALIRLPTEHIRPSEALEFRDAAGVPGGDIGESGIVDAGGKCEWKRMAYAISFREWQKPLVWLHVASAGEFLQAQPVIKKCVKEGAECLLTYSSINAYRWI